MLRGYGDTDVHLVWHEMPFENLAFFLLGQGVEHRTQLPAVENCPYRVLDDFVLQRRDSQWSLPSIAFRDPDSS